jgi:hypothetical protein
MLPASVCRNYHPCFTTSWMPLMFTSIIQRPSNQYAKQQNGIQASKIIAKTERIDILVVVYRMYINIFMILGGLWKVL